MFDSDLPFLFQPENLLLDASGTLKVSDFGLSALSQQVRVSKMACPRKKRANCYLEIISVSVLIPFLHSHLMIAIFFNILLLTCRRMVCCTQPVELLIMLLPRYFAASMI